MSIASELTKLRQKMSISFSTVGINGGVTPLGDETMVALPDCIRSVRADRYDLEKVTLTHIGESTDYTYEASLDAGCEYLVVSYADTLVSVPGNATLVSKISPMLYPSYEATISLVRCNTSGTGVFTFSEPYGGYLYPQSIEPYQVVKITELS